MEIGFVAVAALALVVLAWFAFAYNGLVRRRNRVDSTWSDIDVLLRRRHDLVPNLVATVNRYASHESTVLRAVADARTGALAASGAAAKGQAETILATDVKSVLAVAEAYPNLKANESFLDLQRQLLATEDGIEHARQFYNDSVYGYMNAVQTLPTSAVAAIFGFRPRQFFQAGPQERSEVVIKP